MKNVKLFTLLFLASIAFSSCLELFGEGVEGSGTVAKNTNSDVEGFTKVSVATGINAFIKIGDKENVEIEADDNLLELIIVKVSNGELNIYMEKSAKNYKKLNAYITATSLEAVQVSSGANATVEDNVEAESFTGKSSSGANLTLNGLTAKNTNFNASSGAGIEVEAGSTTDLTVNASSAGHINAFGFETQNCDANASSGGNARINVTKTLAANASSGGNIKFKGNPSINEMHTSSGGNVNKD